MKHVSEPLGNFLDDVFFKMDEANKVRMKSMVAAMKESLTQLAPDSKDATVKAQAQLDKLTN